MTYSVWRDGELWEDGLTRDDIVSAVKNIAFMLSPDGSEIGEPYLEAGSDIDPMVGSWCVPVRHMVRWNVMGDGGEIGVEVRYDP